MVNNDSDNIRSRVISLLADHVGVESEDLHDEDFISEDLHMNAADLTDFSQKLEDSGFEMNHVDLTSTETVGDLIEEVASTNELYE